ncbi:hypothetical protein HDU93_006767, partial [Gonapodya sp. JEL0774]
MVATQVAEEGLDVQPCHLVIRFDLPRTTISFIQSRGRARQHDSTFYFMVNSGESAHARTVTKCLAEAEHLRAAVTAASGVGSVTSDGFEDGDPDAEADAALVIRSTTTSAVLTMGLVVGALFRFCGKLPSDKHYAPRPEFELHTLVPNLYEASVTLPTLLPPELRHFSSGECWASRWAARRGAAREAMKALYEAKWLDEHFQPAIPGKKESLIEPIVPDANFLAKYGDNKQPL